MSGITTHVLDTSRGRPAAGVAVRLEWQAREDEWSPVGAAETDGDGRARSLVPEGRTLEAGPYRLTFDTGAYFARHATPTFYRYVSIVFDVTRDGGHYHVPLLISPWGYTTYRGS